MIPYEISLREPLRDMTQTYGIIGKLCYLFFVFLTVLVKSQEIDQTLSDVAEKLSAAIKEHGKKKVAVLDFTDLQGNGNELGRYVAEELTVNLVDARKDFSVLDRANLNRILAEHKLTATGLVDPENAKKLGMFAGVDALIIGNLVLMGPSFQLTAKIITTETAEIVGAARSKFKSDDYLKELWLKPATDTYPLKKEGDSTFEEGRATIKNFKDMGIEIQPLRIVNGSEYLLTMMITNKNSRKTIWVAANSDMYGVKAVITDPAGNEFRNERYPVTGIPCTTAPGPYVYPGMKPNEFRPSKELDPRSSVTATVIFVSRTERPKLGKCNLQFEFLIGQDFDKSQCSFEPYNLVTKVEAK